MSAVEQPSEYGQVIKLHKPRPTPWSLVPVGHRPATLDEAIRTYIWDRAGRGEITKRTAVHLGDRLRMLANAVGGDVPIGELDRGAILRFQHVTGGHSPASRRSYLSTVKGFCRWALAEHLIETDPTAGFARIREPRRVPRALAQGEVARLLETAGDDLRAVAIIWLMVGCGLRCVEVCNLEVGDWDPDAQTIFVRGKAGHERLLPVPAPVAAAVAVYLESVGHRPGPMVRYKASRRKSPMEPSYVSNVVTALLLEAGVKRDGKDGVGAHSLRHTCASDSLDRCGNVRTVQAILGHQSLATTQIYLRRANLDQMRAALEGRTYGTDVGLVVT